jgi:hypothetical protein
MSASVNIKLRSLCGNATCAGFILRRDEEGAPMIDIVNYERVSPRAPEAADNNTLPDGAPVRIIDRVAFTPEEIRQLIVDVKAGGYDEFLDTDEVLAARAAAEAQDSPVVLDGTAVAAA